MKQRDGWVIYVKVGSKWKLYCYGYNGPNFIEHGVFPTKRKAETFAEIDLSTHTCVVDYIQWEENS